ncbi:MAG: hypothetical protein ACD_31C00004G0008 [uncultured bacterium]|uniref:Membrane protein 6-pyruvoyl-tetrahydropterin synthase-related domain-containing protein n=4 Tax=Candidatus Daviesiibacteriota TaxID=1752718 RepID=A0A0G0H6M2_9BACT|nr:MAG: hypothetical protein ACD_31C00004G0008 [uncultured bacterium]KKQ07719.1 MAG: hypothetical protein US19_C0039G0004 [Candidatus Daviesbacteria bacterium GW2011_GWB1_36_5]KKQ15451.1 MAG: hypothetical protein US28_C0016G0013 [Candidatus Daviesbacteria bacterium GW2011_GWA1_36_8]OGE17455.1 MAG: hypothetical protein A2858_00925 [Candidatus Daviesbacteria bacterium RIFCSPHIGHO2_01_FULL_36_37]OGE36550.1 MAG: hypothetical protein A3E66_02770 [Candidatus Daviesbacteria bacterium RIFCSPHIGHO2_12_F
MNIRKKIILVIFTLVLPYLIVYKAFFTSLPLSWGDAPFYYQENLRELFSFPMLWDFRNANFGAPHAGILWLYLPTFLFGLLNHFLNFEHELLIRLVFFIPATVLSILGSFLLIGKFTSNFKGQILGSFLYAFNTYFLMVLDGGQIGVGLAYGIFPIACLTILNFLQKIDFKNFILAILGLTILTNVDLRIGIISVLFSITLSWVLNSEKRKYLSNFIYLIILLAFVGLLNFFWLVPFILNSGDFPGGRFTEVAEINSVISLLDSLSLYQPHFPLNDFGKVFMIPFYFVFLPLILTIHNLISKDKRALKIVLIYLIFAFLAKGLNLPLGEIYSLITNLPFGQAFRDSTKFYIPLILTASILMGVTFEKLNTKYILTSFFVLLLYLMFLILPSFNNQLNGSLGIKQIDKSFENIYEKTRKGEDFYRTVWFPEVPPLGFSSINHPAIYANRLYQERPFASMIDGDYDLFYFLNNDHFADWMGLLGGKYFFYPENERKKNWSSKEIDERKIFLNFINTLSNFEKLEWNINFSGYKNRITTSPHIFAQKRAYLVIGGDDIYNRLFESDQFNLSAQSFLFSEDCGFNLKNLENVESSDLGIIFYKKQLRDLEMNYLCNKFADINSIDKSEWATRSTNQYLKWKSELLEKGIRTLDYDLGKGVSYSTIAGEKISKNLRIEKKGKYYIPIRYTTATESAGIRVQVDLIDKKLINQTPGNFSWGILGPFEFEKGDKEIIFTNLGGLVVLNTFGLINQDDFINAAKESSLLLKKFKTYYLEDDYQELVNNLEKDYIYLRSKNINPTEYEVLLNSESNWIVFTDSFHDGWELQSGNNKFNSFPGYSMMNLFYKPTSLDGNAKIYFSPQGVINSSVKISIVFLGILFILVTVRFRR